MRKNNMVIHGTMATLEIFDFDENDAGDYVAELRPDERSVPAKLEYKLLPTIKKTKDLGSEVSTFAGKDLDLEFDYSGHPLPKVEVTLNGKPLDTARSRINIYDDKVSIRLRNLIKEDSGILKAIVENECGKDEQLIKVNIADVPSPPLKLTAFDVTSTSVALHWQKPADDNGSPLIKYIIERCTAGIKRWRQVGSVSAYKTEFLADDLYSEESYAFRIVAVNEVGNSIPSNTVDVLTKSEGAEDVQVEFEPHSWAESTISEPSLTISSSEHTYQKDDETATIVAGVGEFAIEVGEADEMPELIEKKDIRLLKMAAAEDVSSTSGIVSLESGTLVVTEESAEGTFKIKERLDEKVVVEYPQAEAEEELKVEEEVQEQVEVKPKVTTKKKVVKKKSEKVKKVEEEPKLKGDEGKAEEKVTSEEEHKAAKEVIPTAEPEAELEVEEGEEKEKIEPTKENEVLKPKDEEQKPEVKPKKVTRKEDEKEEKALDEAKIGETTTEKEPQVKLEAELEAKPKKKKAADEKKKKKVSKVSEPEAEEKKIVEEKKDERKLEKRKPLKLTAQNEVTKVQYGAEKLDLIVAIEGDFEKCAWMKDGSPVDVKTVKTTKESSILSLKNIDELSSGTYTCNVSNKEEKVSTNIVVTVTGNFTVLYFVFII